MTAAGLAHPDQRSPRQQSRRLALATLLNALIVVAQVIAGFAAGSIGLLADAGHNLADTLAVGLALVALGLSRRRPSTRRTYGGLRWPVLAAQANAASLLLVTVWLAVEGVRRLVHPEAVAGGTVFVVALAAACVNGIAAAIVHERHADLNTRAAVLHLVSDAAVSVAVAAAGAVIWAVDGWYRLDPAVSLLVVVLVGWQGVRLLRQVSVVLLEAPPAGVDVSELSARLAEIDGVTGVHDVHVWSLSDRMHAASVHVCVDGDPTLTEARQHSEAVKTLLQGYGISHATVELETVGGAQWCAPDGAPCEAVSRHLDDPRGRRSDASKRAQSQA
jgi:cobalt-zinc-cadmium efflux system protein